jgi:hypothetical protein
VRNQSGETAKSIAARKNHDAAVAAFRDWYQLHRTSAIAVALLSKRVSFMLTMSIANKALASTTGSRGKGFSGLEAMMREKSSKLAHSISKK